VFYGGPKVFERSSPLIRDGTAAGKLAIHYSLADMRVLVFAIAPRWLARTVPEAGRPRARDVDSPTIMVRSTVRFETIWRAIERERFVLRRMGKVSSGIVLSVARGMTPFIGSKTPCIYQRCGAHISNIQTRSSTQTTPHILLARFETIDVVVQSMKHEAKSRVAYDPPSFVALRSLLHHNNNI
jgi:hypothetical protein